MTNEKTYRIADENNGPFSEVYHTFADAEVALEECIVEGTKLNLEYGDGDEKEDEARERAASFFYIVDAKTGEVVYE